jgi:hypothetical protein
MIVVHEPKDPNETEDFALDWTRVLASGETVDSVSVSSSDVTVGTTDISGARTIARLTGGTAGTTADVLFRATTSAGRILDETLRIRVEAR